MASVWRTDFTCQEPGPPPSHGPHTLIDSESNFTHLEVQRKAFLLFRPALGQVSVPARHAKNSICCSAKKSCSDNSSTMFTRPHPPTPTHAAQFGLEFRPQNFPPFSRPVAVTSSPLAPPLPPLHGQPANRGCCTGGAPTKDPAHQPERHPRK